MQVFLVRKIVGVDAGKLFAMKVLRKASLKGIHCVVLVVIDDVLFQLGTEYGLKWKGTFYLMLSILSL